MSEQNQLPDKQCPKCNYTPMSEITYAAEGIRRGWWCEQCGYFDQAIGRERIIEGGTSGKPKPD